jgi:hypothetical protein
MNLTNTMQNLITVLMSVQGNTFVSADCLTTVALETPHDIKMDGEALGAVYPNRGEALEAKAELEARMPSHKFVTMSLGNPMKGRITKASTVNAQVFNDRQYSDYENAVNRQREREGLSADFTVGARSNGGERVKVDGKYTPFVQFKNGNFGVDFIIRSVTGTRYFLDGEAIDREDIVGLKSAKQEQAKMAESQGVDEDNVIVFRSYGMKSIRRMRIFREEHEVGEWVND